MATLVLPETTALMECANPVLDTLRKASAVVPQGDEFAAIVASGMRVQALIDRVADDLEIVPTMEIDGKEALDEMTSRLGRLQTVFADSGEIEKERTLLVGPLNAVVRLINSGYKAPLAFGQGVVDDAKGKMAAFHAAERRRQQEEEARELAARQEAARRAAEAEAAARKQAEDLAAAAQQAQAGGATTMAAELATQASIAADAARATAASAAEALHAPLAASAPAAKVKGAREKWSAKLTSLESLVLHVAERIQAGDRSGLALLAYDESAGNKKAALEKAGFNVPGLRAECDTAVSVRKGVL